MRQRKPLSYVIASVPFLSTLGFSIYSLLQLRSNNLKMLELRDAVIQADESGQGVYERLAELQGYVTSHMNANPPKLGSEPAIQLKNTYERAKSAEQERVSAERTAIANEATAYCEENFRNVNLSRRAECVAGYIADRPVQERVIISDLYRYDYVSPRWTADNAGIPIVIAAASFLIFSFMVFSRLLVRFRIK